LRVASLTLKDIPAEIHERLKSSADSNFRSISQEAFARLQLSFDVEEAAATKLHQSWIDRAVASGPAQPARKDQWQQIQRRALLRARENKR
jgi:hypothetical protein